MIDETEIKYEVKLSFEEIKLPPFEDILLVTKNGPYGKIGLLKSIDSLVPNEFEQISVDNSLVEVLLVNKKLIKKVGEQNIIKTLEKNVFPYASDSEIIKIDFKLKILNNTVEIKA